MKSITMEVSGGEIVGVLGPNGSGKTTLMRCLLGFLRPRSGHVLLDERDVATIARRTYALRVAAVPQEMPTDFPLRVGELVLLGRHPYLPAAGLGFESKSDLAAAEAALQACGVAALVDRPIHQLSGGELRRVFIARAICQGAPIVLLDEPTGGLDLRHQLGILDLLRRRAREGSAVLVVLHDINLAASVCDRVLVLKEGALVAAGAPNDVLNPRTIADVYDVDVQAITVDGTDRRFLVPTGR